MFLIERLLGITCYFILLFFVFTIIYHKKVRVKDALIFYIFVLAIFAYFYEPYETADLFRINQYMEDFSAYDFRRFAKVYLANKSTPAAYCLYWLIARTGNVRLLPAITVIITYSSVFYIMYKSSELYSIHNTSVAVVLLFFMSTGNYMMVISNIRTMLAISLLCLCFFRESVLKTFRLWHIPLYIAAALTHNLALVLIAIRCIAFVVSSSLQRQWKLLIIMLFSITGAYFMLRFDWLIAEVFEKALGYITGDSYSYIWEYIIGFVALIIEANALRMYKKTSDSKLRENWMFLFLCVLTACVFATQFSIFHRLLTYIAPILTIPMLAACFSDADIRDKQKSRVFCLSLLMLAIACTRGELCSYKFFVWG